MLVQVYSDLSWIDAINPLEIGFWHGLKLRSNEVDEITNKLSLILIFKLEIKFRAKFDQTKALARSAELHPWLPAPLAKRKCQLL